MNTHLSQAELLLQRARYREAESLLRGVLAENPDDAEAHTLLAFALLYQRRETDALLEAHAAVRCAPREPGGHYAGAVILTAMGKYDEALSAIRTAIHLYPLMPRYHAVMGEIYLRQRQWQEALNAAQLGLHLDPQDIQCNNIRTIALVKLGRRDEAGQTLDTTLALDPQNAITHANQGWALLHAGRHKQALEHFREALRLDPTLGWAREGIVESLKARNPIYWVMLRYFLWMSRLSGGARWALILGIYFVNRIAVGLAQHYPDLALFAILLNLLYTLFAFLSWTAQPLFNLLLRFNRLGRLSLSEEQIAASNWVAVCLVTAIGCAGAGIFLGQLPFLSAALHALLLIVPLSGLFSFPPGNTRLFLTIYTAGLALLAVISLIFKLHQSVMGAQLSEVFIWGWVLYSWIANAVGSLK